MRTEGISCVASGRCGGGGGFGRQARVRLPGTVATGSYKVLNLFCLVAAAVRRNVRDLRV